MSNVAVITDSTASLPTEMYARYEILMVPYYIHFPDGTSRRDVTEVGAEEFVAYLASLPDDARLPKTANPGVGDYERAYDQAAERSDRILSLHMTSKGSGAYQAALVAREGVLSRLRGVRIEVIDTRNVSMGHGWVALQAARAAAAGADLEEILQLVKRMIPVTRMIQTADTLRYLYMGGRIGQAQYLMGSLLRIRPLVSMEDGEIVALGVARTRSGAYRRMAELVERAVGRRGRIRLALTHADAEEDARRLASLVGEVVTITETLYCPLPPTLAVHSGPGTVGLCYTPSDLSEFGQRLVGREEANAGQREAIVGR
ncbi:MAG: DegV family protein [Chloroflexi bacterium]|nr:DegV family protein [Chloroflexota bacterium]